MTCGSLIMDGTTEHEEALATATSPTLPLDDPMVLATERPMTNIPIPSDSPQDGYPYRDYTNFDLEAEHGEYLQMSVLAALLEDMAGSNFRISWMIDPTHGIEEIAWRASQMLPSFPYEHDLIGKFLNKPNGDAEHDRKVELARGYMQSVYTAVRRLIEDEMLEWEFSMRWPCLRLTRLGLNYYGLPTPPHIQAIEARVNALRRMPYREYLLTDEWKYRREMHIEAAGFRCQLCNADAKPLHVHHRTYANRGRENFYDLVALCGPCHEMFHASGRKIR